MVDHYHMGRIRLKSYAIRDQFIEPSHQFGRTTVYYWQHVEKDKCNATIMTHATVANSNSIAQEAMKKFMSTTTSPSIFQSLRTDVKSGWFAGQEVNDVKVVASGKDHLLLIFVWGNIFFQVRSIGEHDFPITDFLQQLSDAFTKVSKDPKGSINLKANVGKQGLLKSREVSLTNELDCSKGEYSMLIYAASPRGYVDLTKQKDKIVLKLLDSDVNITPEVHMVGIRPNGRFVESEKIAFKLKP